MISARVVAAVVALALLAGWAVFERDVAWRTLARATAMPLTNVQVSGGEPLVAAGNADAAAMLSTIVADRSSAAGVRLSVRPISDDMPASFVAVDVDARGSEASLRAFAHVIEGERPVIRFVRWAIRPVGDGLFRLEARAVAPVARRR